MKVGFVAACAALSTMGFAITFGPGPGEAYGTATGTGHGGAASPYTFSSNIFADVDPGLLVGSIDSVTIFDLQTSSAQGLSFTLHNDEEQAVLMNSIPGPANFNGDYTFVADSSLPKLSEVVATLGTNDVVPSGTYNIEGGPAFLFAPGNSTDFSQFEGTQIRPGYTLLLSNISTEHTGSFGGWELMVTPVPEPATMAGLALGALALFSRGRRK